MFFWLPKKWGRKNSDNFTNEVTIYERRFDEKRSSTNRWLKVLQARKAVKADERKNCASYDFDGSKYWWAKIPWNRWPARAQIENRATQSVNCAFSRLKINEEPVSDHFLDSNPVPVDTSKQHCREKKNHVNALSFSLGNLTEKIQRMHVSLSRYDFISYAHCGNTLNSLSLKKYFVKPTL